MDLRSSPTNDGLETAFRDSIIHSEQKNGKFDLKNKIDQV